MWKITLLQHWRTSHVTYYLSRNSAHRGDAAFGQRNGLHDLLETKNQILWFFPSKTIWVIKQANYHDFLHFNSNLRVASLFLEKELQKTFLATLMLGMVFNECWFCSTSLWQFYRQVVRLLTSTWRHKEIKDPSSYWQLHPAWDPAKCCWWNSPHTI